MTDRTIISARIAQELVVWLDGWCERTSWTRSAAVEQGLRLLRDQYPFGVPPDGPAPSERSPTKDPAPKTPGSTPEPVKGPDPAEVRARSVARLDERLILLRVVSLSRSASQSDDPRGVLQETVRRAAADQGILDSELTDDEADRILERIREKSTTVQQVLKGASS